MLRENVAGGLTATSRGSVAVAARWQAPLGCLGSMVDTRCPPPAMLAKSARVPRVKVAHGLPPWFRRGLFATAGQPKGSFAGAVQPGTYSTLGLSSGARDEMAR
jgi:hypothetical protein